MGTALFLQHPCQFQCRRTHDLLPCNNNVPKSMRFLTLKRITPAASYPFRFDRSKILRGSSNCNSWTPEITTMADKVEEYANPQSISGGGSTVLRGKEEGEKGLEEKSTRKNIPPPPEKPLPDDCCGSGCVRCVWDIYYDELEEYNKLYKNK